MDEAVWLDAAPLLSRVQEALAPGQMVHDDGFSLFESMSAIEIGARRRCLAQRRGSEEAQPRLWKEPVSST